VQKLGYSLVYGLLSLVVSSILCMSFRLVDFTRLALWFGLSLVSVWLWFGLWIIDFNVAYTSFQQLIKITIDIHVIR